MEEYDYLIKIIIIGESGVGKSSLLNMYCDRTYNDNYVSTIGVDFRLKLLKINNNKIKLQIWDTAGQERFKSITLSYYRGAHAIILVFDLTKIHTFNKLTKWIEEIKTYLQNHKYKIFLVGNKSDDVKAIHINKTDIDNFVLAHEIEYFEVSVKKNINVDEVFLKITDNVIKNIDHFQKKKSETIKLNGEKINNTTCC
jgi:Ras-related protein Rab-1A